MEKHQKYIFWGQNASTGDPNPITGKYSFWGKIYRVPSSEDGAEIAAEIERSYPQDLVVLGGRKKMRGYRLGTSVKDFEFHLQWCDSICLDEDNKTLTHR